MKFTSFAVLALAASSVSPAAADYKSMLGGSCARTTEESDISSTASLYESEYTVMDALTTVAFYKVPAAGVAWSLFSGIFGLGGDDLSDLADAMKDYIDQQIAAVTKYVDEQITASLQTNLVGYLNTATRNFQQYEAALERGDEDDGRYDLESALLAMELAMGFLEALTNDFEDQAIHFLPLLSRTAVMHLQLNQEKWAVFGDESIEDENQALYEDYYDMYTTLLPSWWTWRQDQITYDYDTGYTGSGWAITPYCKYTVTDAYTDIECSGYEESWSCSLEAWGEGTQEALENEILVDMLKVVEVFPYLNRLVPGHESDDPIYPQSSTTPLSSYTEGVSLGPYRYYYNADYGDGLAGYAFDYNEVSYGDHPNFLHRHNLRLVCGSFL